MKIEFTTSKYEDLAQGDAFLYRGDLYIKMQDYTACLVSKGESCTLGGATPVTPVPSAKVII